jgi:hypothetical protein
MFSGTVVFLHTSTDIPWFLAKLILPIPTSFNSDFEKPLAALIDSIPRIRRLTIG